MSTRLAYHAPMRWLVPLLLLGSASACDGCQKKQEAPLQKKSETREQCATSSDCADDNPCTEEECRDAKCVLLLTPAGTSCDNETVCDGVATCNGKGQCVPGTPPNVDDGNACTRDSCDSTRGAVHEPVLVDDQDACTKDACDPRTGEVTHDPVEIDDGDDCTFDSCDRQTGPKHEPAPTKYECGSCGEGFHTASRAPSRQCGSDGALQSFCVKSCGSHFYSCDPSCPKGYEEKSRAPNRQCGAGTPMLFCMRASR
ncbi:MAG: hypothetical protein AMXMBFR56_71490 [Polyangiaceae bacterium]